MPSDTGRPGTATGAGRRPSAQLGSHSMPAEIAPAIGRGLRFTTRSARNPVVPAGWRTPFDAGRDVPHGVARIDSEPKELVGAWHGLGALDGSGADSDGGKQAEINLGLDLDRCYRVFFGSSSVRDLRMRIPSA